MSDTTVNYGFQIPSADGHDFQAVDDIRVPITAIDAVMKAEADTRVAGVDGANTNANTRQLISGAQVGKKMVRLDLNLGNTDASGFYTVTHAAGFTPTFVQLFSRVPGSTFAFCWGTDSYTSTQFRARFMHASSGGMYASNTIGNCTAIIWE